MKILLIFNLLFYSPKIINEININEQNEDPNLFVYISHFTPNGGGTFVAGSGWVGTVCSPSKGHRASISLWTTSDLGCAEVRREELRTILSTTFVFLSFSRLFLMR